MAILKTEAIVLKKYDFRETSLIVNFYTRDFGKISAVLKGVRQEPAKFASSLESFSFNEIVFYSKRNSSVHLVSQCDIRDNFDKVRQNISKISVASIMMELIDAVMPQEDKNEEVFGLAIAALKELETNDNAEKIMRIFKIKILSLSGFKPHFNSCIACGLRVNGQAKFSLSLGGLLCFKCYKKDTAARGIFRGTVSSILYIQNNDFRNNLNLGMNIQIKKELDLVLDSFLNFHLERELKSQRVARKLNI